MRWLASAALVSAGLLLTACSALNDERAQPADSQEPAPPIKSMNEVVPMPEAYGEAGQLVFDQSYELELLCPDVEPEDCKPSRERVDALRRQLQEEHEGMNPADGTEQRAIGRLPLAQEAEATLIAWRARNGRLCTKIEYRYPDRTVFGIGGGFGPFGPCEPRTRCNHICLQRVTDFTDEPTIALVGGTVSSSGDQLRVVFLDGKGARYPLRGPVVPGFPDHRVFMLGLGRRLYQRLELLVDGEVSASVDVAREEIDRQLCFRRFPIPPPSDPTETVRRTPNRELQTCLRNA